MAYSADRYVQNIIFEKNSDIFIEATQIGTSTSYLFGVTEKFLNPISEIFKGIIENEIKTLTVGDNGLALKNGGSTSTVQIPSSTELKGLILPNNLFLTFYKISTSATGSAMTMFLLTQYNENIIDSAGKSINVVMTNNINWSSLTLQLDFLKTDKNLLLNFSSSNSTSSSIKDNANIFVINKDSIVLFDSLMRINGMTLNPITTFNKQFFTMQNMESTPTTTAIIPLFVPGLEFDFSEIFLALYRKSNDRDIILNYNNRVYNTLGASSFSNPMFMLDVANLTD